MGVLRPPERQDFSWSLYLVAQIIYLLGLSVKSVSLRRICFIPFAGIICHLAWYTTTRNAINDYGMGTHLFTVLFAAFDFLVLTDVQREIKVIEGPFSGKSIREEPFSTRVRWALKLQGSPRGLGWSFAAKEPYISPAPSKGTTRMSFIVAKMREIAFNIILYDLTGFINRANPCFSQYGCRVTQMSIRNDGLRVLAWRYAFLGYGAGSYLTVNTLHCTYACLSVGMGFTEPWEWPSLFGSFGDTFTVRRFWGRFWHQMMRRFLLSATGFAARKLKFRRQSKFTELFRLAVAFFISAFIHYAGGDVMILGSWRGGSLLFFGLQPLAIVVEESISAISNRIGISRCTPRPIKRAFGYFWVATWFAYTVPIFAEPQLDVGFFESGLSFSLILGIWKGDWSPKV